MSASSGYFWWSEPVWQALLVLLIGAILAFGGSVVVLDAHGVAERIVHRHVATFVLRIVALVVALFGVYLLVAQTIAWVNGIVA